MRVKPIFKYGLVAGALALPVARRTRSGLAG